MLDKQLESVYESGQLRPHAEFYLVASLRRELRTWLAGNARPSTAAMVMALCFPHIEEGESVKMSQVRPIVERIVNELTFKMMELAPHNFPNREEFINKLCTEVIRA